MTGSAGGTWGKSHDLFCCLRTLMSLAMHSARSAIQQQHGPQQRTKCKSRSQAASQNFAPRGGVLRAAAPLQLLGEEERPRLSYLKPVWELAGKADQLPRLARLGRLSPFPLRARQRVIANEKVCTKAAISGCTLRPMCFHWASQAINQLRDLLRPRAASVAQGCTRKKPRQDRWRAGPLRSSAALPPSEAL